MHFQSRGADRITALVFFVLGGAMSYGGFVMDRLEIRHIHPASLPGLVPMILGGILMLCAVLLALGTRGQDVQQRDAPDNSPTDSPANSPANSWTGFAAAAGLSICYALVLVGWLPFWVASALYIAGFAGWFFWRDGSERRPIVTFLSVVIYAVTMAVGISVLFRYGFLVRLP